MSDIYDRLPGPGSTTEQRRKAVRAVASMARDAADAAQLLSALGLSAEEGRP